MSSPGNTQRGRGRPVSVYMGRHTWRRYLVVVGNRFREARGDMSLFELARRTELAYDHLWRIEAGERAPSLRVIRLVSAALGCDGRELLP